MAETPKTVRLKSALSSSCSVTEYNCQIDTHIKFILVGASKPSEHSPPFILQNECKPEGGSKNTAVFLPP